MGLADLWRSYKVLIVMGSSLGLIHWGWYHMKDANPQSRRRDELPEPGIVAFLSANPPPAPRAKSD